MVDYPDWLERQVGIKYLSAEYLTPGIPWDNRRKLIRDYVDHLVECNEEVTLGGIQAMFQYVDRGYNLAPGEINKAIASRRRRGLIPKYYEGHKVMVGEVTYRSIRDAAKAENVAVETVRNRIRSTSPKWASWTKPLA